MPSSPASVVMTCQASKSFAPYGKDNSTGRASSSRFIGQVVELDQDRRANLIGDGGVSLFVAVGRAFIEAEGLTLEANHVLQRQAQVTRDRRMRGQGHRFEHLNAARVTSVTLSFRDDFLLHALAIRRRHIELTKQRFDHLPPVGDVFTVQLDDLHDRVGSGFHDLLVSYQNFCCATVIGNRGDWYLTGNQLNAYPFPDLGG